jgi:hypothetical protein
MLRPIQRGEIMKLLRWLYDRFIVWTYDYFFTTRLIRNNLIVTDHDKTIGYNKKSTFEEDGDLPKWRKANTLWNNLFYWVPLPIARALRECYDNGDCIVIMTSREKKWWLPFVLWWHGIKYDLLLERHEGTTLSSADLKKFMMWHLLDKFVGVRFKRYLFIDDLKSNRDSIEANFQQFEVIDANEINRGWDL